MFVPRSSNLNQPASPPAALLGCASCVGSAAAVTSFRPSLPNPLRARPLGRGRSRVRQSGDRPSIGHRRCPPAGSRVRPPDRLFVLAGVEAEQLHLDEFAGLEGELAWGEWGVVGLAGTD